MDGQFMFLHQNIEGTTTYVGGTFLLKRHFKGNVYLWFLECSVVLILFKIYNKTNP